MVTAQVLKATHTVDDGVRVVENKVVDVNNKVADVDGHAKAVDAIGLRWLLTVRCF